MKPTACSELCGPIPSMRGPFRERHRIVFYIGHLEAFDWNLLARYALDRPAFHPSFDRLFAFGIDPPPGQLPDDQPSDWPALREVERYNQRVRDEIDELLAFAPGPNAARSHRAPPDARRNPRLHPAQPAL